MSEQTRLQWVCDERMRSSELRAGGCWARVYRGEPETIRNGTSREVLYWSAGVAHLPALMAGTVHSRAEAEARAVRGLLRCVKLAEAEERVERAEDAPPVIPPEFGGERPVALEDGSRLMFCDGGAAEVRPHVFKGEARTLGRFVRGESPRDPDELALLFSVHDKIGQWAAVRLEPQEARALAAELVKRAEVVERERAL